MQRKRLGNGSPRGYAVVPDAREPVLQELTRFAEAEHLGATALTAIGASESATSGYFDIDVRRYVEIPVEEQVEVLTPAGDIVGSGSKLRIRCDGSTRGGYLLDAVVRPTLETMRTESPAELVRRDDPASGLPLIAVSAGASR